MLVLEIRDPRGALLLPLQPAEQTCGTAKEGLDGAWSFRPFVLLSMAIPSGLSLLSKGCQQLRFCFLNSKIMPVLPFLLFPASVWLSFSSPSFLSHNFPSFYFYFPLFPFLLVFWEEEGSTCYSHPYDKLLFQVARIQHIPLKASCQHYQFSSFLPLLVAGSTSTFLI